ncbi:high mobility group box domain-containing protein, partial [Blyttiomyces helicus]
KVKAKKDPNAPKKPPTSYLLFSIETRPQLKNDNPEASFGALGKMLGDAWKVLPDNEKETYKVRAEAEKTRYDQEMANYHP